MPSRKDPEKRLKLTLWFLVKLLVLALPLYLIIWLSIDLSQLQVAAASELEFMLKQLGYDVFRDGSLVTVDAQTGNPFTFFIVEDCTAWKSMLFLFALILAVPSIPWKRRLAGIAAGLPLLWFGNLMRNLTVVLTERAYGIDTAMVVHDWLWRAGLVIMVLLIWLVWWRWAMGKGILSRRHKSKAWKSIMRSLS